jgi:hypothetical protein
VSIHALILNCTLERSPDMLRDHDLLPVAFNPAPAS